MVLAAAGTTDLAQMASLADKIMEVATPMGSTQWRSYTRACRAYARVSAFKIKICIMLNY